MSVKVAPYTMSERIDYGYMVPQLVDNKGLFDTTRIGILEEIIGENSYRRNDELDLYEWYSGRGAPINTRVLKKGDVEVTNKVNNKIQHNYLKRLTRIRTGYLGGQPVKYTLDSEFYQNGEGIDSAYGALHKFVTQSNLSDILAENIVDCTLYGQSGRLLYIDKSPFSTNSDNVILAMHVKGFNCLFLAERRWWMPEISIRFVSGTNLYEVYDAKYKYTVQEGTIIKIEEHMIGFNPLIPYYNNASKSGNMDDCLSKINDVDEQRSNLSSLLTTQRLVLKIFKDVDIDADTVEKTEQMGYIKLKTNEDGQGDVFFETLNIDSDASETHIKEIEKAIYMDSGIVNLEDKQFGNESAAAKKFYLISMESNCIDTESKFRASDYMMFGIVSNFNQKLNIPLQVDSIESEWQRNLPYEASEDVDNFVKLFGKVPLEEAYGILPFVKDPTTLAERYIDESKKVNYNLTAEIDSTTDAGTLPTPQDELNNV